MRLALEWPLIAIRWHDKRPIIVFSYDRDEFHRQLLRNVSLALDLWMTEIPWILEIMLMKPRGLRLHDDVYTVLFRWVSEQMLMRKRRIIGKLVDWYINESDFPIFIFWLHTLKFCELKILIRSLFISISFTTIVRKKYLNINFKILFLFQKGLYSFS